MSMQLIGTAAIAIAMAIAFMQKASDEERRPVPPLTTVAVIILLVVGVVDTWLYFRELETFTSYIKGRLHPLFGFGLMWVIFLRYWKRRGTVEALDVIFGILLGHFFWSWC